MVGEALVPVINVRKITVPKARRPDQIRSDETMPQDVDGLRVVEPKDVALRLRLDYSHGVKDHNTKVIEEVAGLCSKVKRSNLDMDSLLAETADMVSRLFGIASVAIAIWDPALRLYKFRVVTGLGQEGTALYKSISFTKEQIVDDKTYPCHEISKQTKLYLTEDHPYVEGEEPTFARPTLLGMKRRSLTDSLEADYLCVFIHGPNDETIGWIEISGTRLRKLPDVITIRWIELIACMMGAVLHTKW